MPRFQIVTDSGAQLAPMMPEREPPVKYLPNRIITPESIFAEGVDVTAESALQIFARQNQLPRLEPPRTEDYAALFTSLTRTHDGVLCIVPSRHLSPHWERARAAAQGFAASAVRVVDSQSISAGQAMLVRAAVESLPQVRTLDDAERILRGHIGRTYQMLYVEHVEHLARHDILNPNHTLMSAMLGLKPMLVLEGGHFKAVEKTRSRMHALDRLFEFAVEFTDSARMVIIHDHSTHDAAARLHERLKSEIKGQLDVMIYNPSLVALIGTGGLGVAILEPEDP